MKIPRSTRRYVSVTVAGLVSAAILWAIWPGDLEQKSQEPAQVEADLELTAPPVVAPAGTSGSGDLLTKAEDAPVEPVPKVRVYKVKPGDTVEGIAGRHGLSASSILWSNGLAETTVLQIDQELLIPAVDGILHVVADGDTFWEIALTHNVEADDVIRANAEISPDSLQPGKVLLVPGGAPARRSTAIASRSAAQRPVPAPSPAPIQAPGPNPGLIWPLQGTLTDTFGWRTHPVYGTRNFHEGIDIAAPVGTPVKAVAGGRVTLSEWYGGYGLTIRIDHGDGMVSRYSHNSTLLVTMGQSVAVGDVIALSGNTGVSTGPHLDFGLYRGGTPIDPLALLPR